MGPVFWLSLRQLTGRWRLALIFLLAALPVGLAVILSLTAGGGGDSGIFINLLLDGMLVAAILPIVTMALSTAAFGNEVEDRTLSYLVLKPIARWRIAMPKVLASIAISGPLLVASGVAAALLGFDGDVRAAVAVGVAIFAGVAAYAAVFTWLGLLTNRAIAFALIYVLLWEGVIGTFLQGVNYLSVRGYTLAIMYGINETGFEELGSRVIEFPAGIVGAVVVTVVFLFLLVRRLHRMDVP
ncbi:MAG: ABC transporter permease subunit [Chloroflexi bacterium]|nr:ABC transporter permease subunit [Chloroflexota bacterium]